MEWLLRCVKGCRLVLRISSPMAWLVSSVISPEEQMQKTRQNGKWREGS